VVNAPNDTASDLRGKEAIVVVTTALLLRLGERVYRRTALHTGPPAKLREALASA
jgi:hypothetical protein